MRFSGLVSRTAWGALVLALVSLPVARSYAVPSFSRQTGVTCASCHTVFPQLTPFGRNFKLNGYTMIADTQGQTKHLEEGSFPPVSAMVQSSYAAAKTEVPGTQNGNALLPDELSLFYAGRISANLGAFIQLTYDGVDDHFTMDNMDIRFARAAGPSLPNITYGLTLNNDPTVSDLWNSTPAWSYPYASSEVTPAPAAAARIDGGLAQQVAGLGGYLSWNDMVYVEGSMYRSFQIGADVPPTADDEDVVKGVAPYWRLALSRQKGEHNVMLGTYGIRAQLYPGGGEPLGGATNDFTDTGIDAQYQWLHDTHTVTLHSTWLREKQDWDAAFAVQEAGATSDLLKTFRIDGTYYYGRFIGGSLAYFTIWGDRDAVLYAPSEIDGSRTGKPDSRGFIAELDFVPWYNTKLSIHYTVYNRFNGSKNDYDGFGRDASDNNTLYVNAWLMF